MSGSYARADRDRYLYEHSLSVASEEMRALNDAQRQDAARALADERAASFRRLSAERQRAETTLRSIGDGVIRTDSKGCVEFINPTACTVTGWREEEALGRPVSWVFRARPAGAAADLDLLAAARDRGAELPRGTLLVARDLEERAIEGSISPMHESPGQVSGYVIVFRDVTREEALRAQIEHQARHDMLTGLYNRYRFSELLEQLVQDAAQRDAAHALLYIDLDQFKIVNDTCGHTAGDRLLGQVSGLLRARTRLSDAVARLGGDEFAVLLRDCPLETARRIAESLVEALRHQRFSWEGRQFEIGASVGLVPITRDAGSPQAVLSAADVACYIAKDKGRNQVHLYRGDDERVRGRYREMDWATRISRALDEDGFVLCRQAIVPVVAPQDGRLHYEILLRLEGEDGQLVPPGAFIPAAERYQLMAAVDRWVIHHTLGALAAHPDLLARTRCCAINLSGQSLGDAELLPFIQQRLAETGVAAEKLCFEVTETAAIANLVNAQHLLRQLRALGCRFALDDFGSGLSSFAYLKELSLDYLKIDGVFVRDIDRNPQDLAMLQAIQQVGRVLGLKTVAEFVENDAILARLRQIGVDYAQGFGVARPGPLTGAEAVSPSPGAW